ncbi:cobaltochelatase subunit CobN [Synechococcus sp. A10-1-5-1]|uniref:cobaltochelatase subunit CobN n=1 Tax=Synechococcus sp. A10-1-5-1 TaxID=2936507 RepID=UPI002000CD23|nr:cobaltochelatase subunit CobN [Synechococcus sp. A10-1-5-1]UPM50528.1 cobaltochelatase subunit CobN [Synechococcus sp. A10-1-5-1]
MHRLAAVPGSQSPDDGVTYVEQPGADLVFLSSADTDLAALSSTLDQNRFPAGEGRQIQGLNLASLQHPAVLDHYIRTSLSGTRIVLIRLLGGRGHWSYGLEQFRQWAQSAPDRNLVVLAGTEDEDQALAALSSVPAALAVASSQCLREGGSGNLLSVLQSLGSFLEQGQVTLPQAQAVEDPKAHDWRNEPGPRVGVILYRALLQSGDLALSEALLDALRQRGMSPRALWVSSLRDPGVQRGALDLLQREQVDAVLCTTSFASVQFAEAGLGAPLWEELGVPIFQVLCSTQSREGWQASPVGLASLDLTLQVAMPELDGRITTRVGAFKELANADDRLATALHHYVPDPERLDWIAQLVQRWCDLRATPAPRRRLALVLANYPTRNARLANGVGLDTPASAAAMLHWLGASGYEVGSDLPCDGDALITALLAGRTNDPESTHLKPVAHLSLQNYLAWYGALPSAVRSSLETQWGPPEQDPCLERDGFPIHGLRFGHVVVMIQPSRGYDRDPSLSYHSPDLAPTHHYLAHYLWLNQCAQVQLVCHVGKHGNLEWLPGKGLGLSSSCFPELALGPMPHLYPFIVNDPGEGSQAKRRAQAVILDHLTPPLGRAGLHGDLRELEALIDEYWEAVQLGSARSEALRSEILEQLSVSELGDVLASAEGDDPLDAADGYLCELKEAQIRTGLHRFGSLPADEALAELLACLARPPQDQGLGLTQALARDAALLVDPWSDLEETPLDAADQGRLMEFGLQQPRRCGDAIEWLEQQALQLCRDLLGQSSISSSIGPQTEIVLTRLKKRLVPNLLHCGEAEQSAFLRGVAGQRIAAGPSGAPTRGRPDLLPTGRNFYSVDLRGLPTEAAWDLGRRSAELLIDQHLMEEGEPLHHLALSVWGTSTMRNGGEDIAQALALMGVRPVWDGPSRRLVDLELIPLSALGRPRVDVTLRISGLFRDAFPQLVGWVNRATALVAFADESTSENPLAAAAKQDGHAWRVYGSAPGAYGAGLQGLIDSGEWEERADLAQAYLNWGSWRYEGDGTGALRIASDRGGFKQRLESVQVVLQNQDNREHDCLDSDDYYQFQGGLSAAVESVRGVAPAVWFGDHSRHQRPRIHRVEKEFDKVLRSRVLNPRWIEGMLQHGYKGGFEMAASLDYLFAYDASTGRVPDWSYGSICQQWLESPAVLDFLKTHNPWALRDMGERLLEAHHRGLWSGAQKNQLAHLRELVLSAEALIEG